VDRGVDLGEQRDLEIHFWAWNQRNAALLAQELYRRGYLVLMLNPAKSAENPDLWSIEAEAKLTINQMVDEVFTDELLALASMFSAQYDGWGTSV
jgi:regulator of RNase E activity RraB